ncbi:MAG: hypothetical protein RJB25_1193, partial [Bacteroidota bacterium]
ILSLNDAYQTVLNPESSTLDRQMVTLIMLCRALLSEPAVLLWDTHLHYLSVEHLQHVLTYMQKSYKGTLLLASIHEYNLALIHEKLNLC